MTARNKNQDPDPVGRFAYEGLDRVIHEKARLGILASLATHEDGLAFNDLKQLCALTDGNLSRHLAVLGEAGFVKTRKTQRDGRTHTTVQLTSQGRRRFVDYIAVLEGVVSDAQREAGGRKRKNSSTGWSPV